MSDVLEELRPSDFVESAARAVEACAGLPLAGQARRLAEDGLIGILAPEASGGLGLGLPFAAAVATQAGARLLGFPIVESIVAAHCLAQEAPAIAGEIVSGAAIATVAWSGEAARGADGNVEGTVGRAPWARHARYLLVRLPGGAAGLIDLSASEAGFTDGVELDLDRPLDTVAFPPRTRLICELPPESWTSILRHSRALHAALVLGSSETCHDLARAYVTERVQFGKPLVANQAIRHMLARQKLGLEGMREAINWCARDVGAEHRISAETALLAAAQEGIRIIESSIQMFGGMGYTWEIPLHRHLKRVRTIWSESEVDDVREHVFERLRAATGR